jgi:hypothetical protein
MVDLGGLLVAPPFNQTLKASTLHTTSFHHCNFSGLTPGVAERLRHH